MEINLVLSGGGVRGIAHLGVIKLLQEKGISIQKISGVSMGAVVGAFIAAGYNPDEVLKIFVENKLLYLIRPAFNGGMFRMTKWEDLLLKYFPRNSFEDLKIPLFIQATDINACEPVHFNSGQLVLPVLASCSVPGIFEPIQINNRQLVDGGVLNNLPVDVFLDENIKIIASHVNPLLFQEKMDSTFKIMERSIVLALREKTESCKSHIALFIEPEELSGFSMFDFDKAEEIFSIGYKKASLMLKKF